VVVIPSSSAHPKPDPIVWFAGGPGDSGVDMVSRVRPLFGAAPDRDLVFIDQRGTGASSLTCPAFPVGGARTVLRDSVQACLHRQHADLATYTTSNSTDDVSEVLTDLGYKTVNLVGISYGATAAQVFLLRHPAQVRTMTLLSGTLLDVPVFERFPANAARALDTIFAECARQPACHHAFPRLRADWAALWTSLPWVVPARQSPTGRRVVFDADWVAAQLHQLLFTTTSAVAIPVLVHTLGAATDRTAAILAIARALQNNAEAAPGPARLLAYVTRCNEPWARDDPNRLVGAGSFEYHHDLADARWWQDVCTLMPRAGAGTSDLAVSRTPVLTLNGKADPQDPPANMAGARRVWPNSRTLAVPAQGHDIDPHSAACEIPIIAAFIADAGQVDTSCLSRLGPPEFALNLHELSH
jgi:pimeloyl-ACP methyl ester carboxylesterase